MACQQMEIPLARLIEVLTARCLIKVVMAGQMLIHLARPMVRHLASPMVR
jgi:hypothetical protein